jgi:hypothetical protein
MSRRFLMGMEDLGRRMEGYGVMLRLSCSDELDEKKTSRTVKSFGLASLMPLVERDSLIVLPQGIMK